jgi:hypothetical protein
VQRHRNSVDSNRVSKLRRPNTGSTGRHHHRPHTDRRHRDALRLIHRFGRRSNDPRPLPFHIGPTRRRHFHANRPGVLRLKSRSGLRPHRANQGGRCRRSGVPHLIRSSADSSRYLPGVTHPNAILCIRRNPVALRHHHSRRHHRTTSSRPGARPHRNSAVQNLRHSDASRQDAHRMGSSLSSCLSACCLRDRPKGHQSAGGEIGRQAWQTMLRHACRIRAVSTGSFRLTPHVTAIIVLLVPGGLLNARASLGKATRPENAKERRPEGRRSLCR